jgi:hypothetical protein
MTHDKHLSYATGGKIEVQRTEASSLRVELEGLITAYELLPPDLYITHNMDNTQAIAIHDRLRNYGLPPPPRKLMRMHYRRTIALLWSRMQSNEEPTSRSPMSTPTLRRRPPGSIPCIALAGSSPQQTQQRTHTTSKTIKPSHRRASNASQSTIKTTTSKNAPGQHYV